MIMTSQQLAQNTNPITLQISRNGLITLSMSSLRMKDLAQVRMQIVKHIIQIIF